METSGNPQQAHFEPNSLLGQQRPADDNDADDNDANDSPSQGRSPSFEQSPTLVHTVSPGSSIQLVVGQDLQVDPSDASEFDSALGDDDRLSYTTSLKSTVTAYRYVHGRRFHAFDEDAYWLPNDEQETERLDIQHHVWALTLNHKLHIAPLPQEIHHVLDVGTGTGGWAIEFADLHPEAQVIGTDLSPIQPNWTPPNCSFICDNAEDEWVFDRKFDFVHSRMLLMGIHDWPKYFRQAWDNLQPGGWIEVEEVQFPACFADDGSVPPDAPLLVWSQRVQEAFAKNGIDTLCANHFRDMITKQGYVKIKEKWPKWALGPWPKGEKEKTIGIWTLENTKQLVSAIAMSLWTKYLGWSPEAVELFLIEVRKDLDDRRRHYYWQM